MKNISAISVLTALALTACGGTSTSPNGTTSPTTLTYLAGQAQSWNGGGAEVRYEAYSPVSRSTEVVAAGPLASDGKLSLTLPSDTVIAPFTSAVGPDFNGGGDFANGGTCSSFPTISDPNARLAAVDSLLVYQSGKITAYLLWGTVVKSGTYPNFSTTSNTNVMIYVDRPVRITGTLECRSSSSTSSGHSKATFNLSLVKGWNLAGWKFNLNVSSNGTVNTYSDESVIGAGNASFPWTVSPMIPYATSIGTQSLFRSSLSK